MSLRILLGFSRAGQRGTARCLYIGESQNDLATARASAPDASFRILNNPTGINKPGNTAVLPAPVEVAVEEVKAEEVKAEEVKAEEVKAEEVKAEEVKAEAPADKKSKK